MDNRTALSIPEACISAGVSKDLIYDAINSGELSSLKIGRRRLITPESLHEWIKLKEKQTKKEMSQLHLLF
jgi:excisionase family DNA binding protein